MSYYQNVKEKMQFFLQFLGLRPLYGQQKHKKVSCTQPKIDKVPDGPEL